MGKAIKVGFNPQAIAITPNGKTAYVGSFNPGTVTPINIATNTPGNAIKVGSEPLAIVMAHSGHALLAGPVTGRCSRR